MSDVMNVDGVRHSLKQSQTHSSEPAAKKEISILVTKHNIYKHFWSCEKCVVVTPNKKTKIKLSMSCIGIDMRDEVQGNQAPPFWIFEFIAA